METELVMSVESAGKALGLSRATAYKLAREGRLPILKMGRKLLVPRCALQRMLENTQPAAKN